MARQRISSGSPFEKVASFSRAVVAGDWVFVSGTTGMKDGKLPDDVREQTRNCFATITAALAKADATLDDVVRVVVYVVNRADVMPVCEVVAEYFKDILPANTTIGAFLALPEMKVEIEVTALKGQR